MSERAPVAASTKRGRRGHGEQTREDILAAAEALLLRTGSEEEVSIRAVADAVGVPVGLLLSGGVDSSLITALAARAAGTLSTYTVGFEDAPAYDERAHAELIAQHFGTRHTVLVADAVSADVLPALARQFDDMEGPAHSILMDDDRPKDRAAAPGPAEKPPRRGADASPARPDDPA